MQIVNGLNINFLTIFLKRLFCASSLRLMKGQTMKRLRTGRISNVVAWWNWICIEPAIPMDSPGSKGWICVVRILKSSCVNWNMAHEKGDVATSKSLKQPSMRITQLTCPIVIDLIESVRKSINIESDWAINGTRNQLTPLPPFRAIRLNRGCSRLCEFQLGCAPYRWWRGQGIQKNFSIKKCSSENAKSPLRVRVPLAYVLVSGN